MFPHSFHPEASKRVATLRADSAHFLELAKEVEGHLQELASLAAFYSRFAAAYAALGPEVARRRRYLGGVARVVQECQQRLEGLRAEEEAERGRFAASHGQYLPASLCPVIQEGPERFAVRPDVQVRSVGNLIAGCMQAHLTHITDIHTSINNQQEALARLPVVDTTGDSAAVSLGASSVPSSAVTATTAPGPGRGGGGRPRLIHDDLPTR